MLAWSNSTNAGTSKTLAQGPAFIAGTGGGATFLWCPTAMEMDNDALIRNPAARTSSTIYAKGVSEHLRIQTNTGVPWFHRRICFTWRGPGSFRGTVAGDTPTQPFTPYLDTTAGIQRPWLNQNINAMPTTVNDQRGIIFKGQQNIDWSDPLIAPVDTTRVDLKFDKTWTLQSGNANGVVRERKLWHGMNKNLTYDEDENGQQQGTTYYSVDSKRGMGDYFIYDIITPGEAAGS